MTTSHLIRSRKNDQSVGTVEILNPLGGTWQSTDERRRWKLTFANGACTWVERNSSGATLSRNVYPFISGSQYRIERANDGEVLTFLGARANVREQILARSPGPSFMLLARSGGAVTAEWRGLWWSVDTHGNLDRLEFKSHTYTLTP